MCAVSGGNGESRELFYAVEWRLGELPGAGEDPPQLIHAADGGRWGAYSPSSPRGQSPASRKSCTSDGRTWVDPASVAERVPRTLVQI